VRGLIIGFGSIGKRHARNIRRLQPHAALTVLRRSDAIDPDEAALGVTRTTSLDEALREKPQFAVVANPSSRHAEVLLPLLQAGVACYIEKPVVTNAADVGRLRALLHSASPVPVTFAGCNLRFLPSLAKLRALLAAGKIGRPVRASLQVGQWLPDWRPHQDYRRSYSADAAEGGGVMLDLIHEIDVARWLFGEFDQVKAVAGKFSMLEINAEDSACILLAKAESGPLTAINLDYVSRRRVRRYEIVGDVATLAWDLATQTLDLITAEAVQRVDTGEAGYDVAETYVHAMQEFLQCVHDSQPTSQGLADGLLTTELALRARASAEL
jgi:predicted dehydrogenase